jgi:hypothetical protein
MTKRILLVAVGFIFLFSMKIVAQKRGPSTPEERKRAVGIATLLESD